MNHQRKLESLRGERTAKKHKHEHLSRTPVMARRRAQYDWLVLLSMASLMIYWTVSIELYFQHSTNYIHPSVMISLLKTFRVNINSVQSTRRANKKFFALHIGPSKTGTTAIQEYSGANSDFETALRNDNVIYVGRGQAKVKRVFEKYSNAVKCMRDVIEEQNITINSGHKGIVRSSCWKARHFTKNTESPQLEVDENKKESFHGMLMACWDEKSRYMLDMSIIDSDEAHSYVNAKDKVSELLTIFDLLGYDEIILIGAYRRWFDWIASVYKEYTKGTCLGYIQSPFWKIHNKTRKGTFQPPSGKEGVQCKPIWDFVWKFTIREGFYGARMWYRNLDETFAAARMLAPSRTIIKVLNYFQQYARLSDIHTNGDQNESYSTSITTEFYCHALGSKRTPNTCRLSRDVIDKNSFADENNYEKSNVININGTEISQTRELRQNKGSLSGTMYNDIIIAAQKRGWLPKSSSAIFNNITAGGATMSSSILANLPNTWVELARYHKNLHGVNQSSTFGSERAMIRKLPLICPPKQKLETLLNKSLLFEEILMCENFPELRQERDPSLSFDEHKRVFWDIFVAKEKTFCSVDTRALFGSASSWGEVLHGRLSIEKW